ncbi:ImmA/IrrE family metallo-endopeptidase [Bacillus subtilis]|uniref:ImmA/IrrE family metallo-endopeptidase n=1 Tax=Bacillus subtilis TaxID=1423 RepID=UPI0029C35742|nr:ImmA/IrrE family metallo-endopeptidase [Bacillus subtilis]MDX6158072.1 ImmA/IrrE family metallo-endopeptidase [Bacillus subtilis]
MNIYTSKSIKHKAQEIIKKNQTNNVSIICNNLSILRLESNLGNVNGFLQYCEEEGEYIIHINENAGYRNFVIAHELGHYFLHKKLNSFKLSNCSVSLEEKLEQQANIFASELLVTDKMILDANINFNEYTLNEIASYFRVPSFVIKHKIEQLKFSSSRVFNIYDNKLIAQF